MTGKDIAQQERISANEFRLLGLADVAYIRPKREDGRRVFAIYSAEGTELAVADNHGVAVAFLRDHDLEPVGVH